MSIIAAPRNHALVDEIAVREPIQHIELRGIKVGAAPPNVSMTWEDSRVLERNWADSIQ